MVNEDEEVITDHEQLLKLDGAKDNIDDDPDETFTYWLRESGELEGIEISDSGIFIEFDKKLGKLKYITEYLVGSDLNNEDVEILQDHTVNMWQEGIGVAFAQLTISAKFGVYVDGDDQVGNEGLNVIIEM